MTELSVDQLTLFGSLLLAAGVGLSMSGHCFGMCGALASVIAMTGKGKPHWRVLAYNTGRVITYFFMGAIAGAVGQRLQISLQQSWLPKAVMAISCAIILFAALALMGLIPDRLLGTAFPSRLLAKLIVRDTPRIPPPVRVFVIGLLFGFLPCAATFGMLGAALGTGAWYHGGLILLAFGLGTWPVMIGVPYVAQAARCMRGKRYGWMAGTFLLLLGGASAWSLWGMFTATGCCNCR